LSRDVDVSGFVNRHCGRLLNRFGAGFQFTERVVELFLPDQVSVYGDRFRYITTVGAAVGS